MTKTDTPSTNHATTPPASPPKPAPAPGPAPDRLGEASKWFAGALGAAAALAALLGISGVALDRILINAPLWLLGSIVLFVLAVFVGVLAPTFLDTGGNAAARRQRRKVRLVFASAALLFVGGAALLGYAAMRSAANQERPAVEAKLVESPEGLMVEGTVSAGGMTNKQHVLLLVYGRSTSDKLAGTGPQDSQLHIGHPRPGDPEPKPSGEGDYIQLILGTRVGPDRNGQVKLPFSVPLGPGLYDHIEVHAQRTDANEPPARSACSRATDTIACRSLWVPPAPARPSLAASFSPDGAVKADIATSGLAVDDRVKVTVRRLHGQRLGRGFYVGTLAPDRTGALKRNVSVWLPANVTRVCVRAKVIRAGRADAPQTDPRERAQCFGGADTVVSTVIRRRR